MSLNLKLKSPQNLFNSAALLKELEHEKNKIFFHSIQVLEQTFVSELAIFNSYPTTTPSVESHDPQKTKPFVDRGGIFIDTSLSLSAVGWPVVGHLVTFSRRSHRSGPTTANDLTLGQHICSFFSLFSPKFSHGSTRYHPLQICLLARCEFYFWHETNIF